MFLPLLLWLRSTQKGSAGAQPLPVSIRPQWWSWHKTCPGNAQCAVRVGASWGADGRAEAAAYPTKTPSGHSFELSPVKRGKIGDCVAPLSPRLSHHIFRMHFVRPVSLVSGGFVSRRQAQPFLCTPSGFYLPRVFPSHFRKYKMQCLGIFMKALKQSLLRLASFCNGCWWCFTL